MTSDYYAHDVAAEIGHAFDAYRESEGLTFDTDGVEAYTGEAETVVTVTRPTGEQYRFKVRVTEL